MTENTTEAENTTEMSPTEVVCRRYHEVLRRGAPRGEFAEVLDMSTHREECVGYTPGWVGADDALRSFAAVSAALRDLDVEFVDLHVLDDRVFARLRVGATITEPRTGADQRVSTQGADFVRVADGKVVERRWLVGNPGRRP